MKLTPRLLCHALCLGVLASAATSASAKPAYVPATVNLRAAPGTGSEIVSKIPGGSLIDADNCTEGWCSVTWQGKTGFAKETALDMSGRVPQRAPGQYPTAERRVSGPQRVPGEVYDEGPDYVAEGPPVVYYGPRPYYYGYVPYYSGWGWRHRW
jgi:uncharacterized protein YraI